MKAMINCGTLFPLSAGSNDALRSIQQRKNGLRRRLCAPPAELTAALGSLREIYPGRTITAVFQPHLYSRTLDHYKGFGVALSLADRRCIAPDYTLRVNFPWRGLNRR